MHDVCACVGLKGYLQGHVEVRWEGHLEGHLAGGARSEPIPTFANLISRMPLKVEMLAKFFSAMLTCPETDADFLRTAVEDE